MGKRRIKFRINIISIVFFGCMIFLDHSLYVLIAFIAAAIHECGHLLASKVLGIPFRIFELDLFGASLTIDGKLYSYRDESLLAAAGPFMNILSSLVLLPCAVTLRDSSSGEYATFFIAASMGLCLLNLLPVKSFDGGRMAYCLCARFVSPAFAEKVISVLTFLSVFVLWGASVYLMLRTSSELSLFIFASCIFMRIFIQNKN